MQTYKELVAKSHDYLKSLDKDKLNQYEKKFVKELLSNKDRLSEYFFDREVIAQMPLLNATALINAGGALPNLLAICTNWESTRPHAEYTALACAGATWA